MKRALFFCVILILAGISNACGIRINRTIDGSGNIVSEERSMGNFTGIDVSRSIHVILTQGALQPVQIKADDNLMEYIRTDVRDNRLKISLPSGMNVTTDKGIFVYVTVPHIRSLEVSTSAQIESTNMLNVDELELSGSTSGTININVAAQKIDIETSTSADIKLSGTATEMEVDCSTSGSVDAQDVSTQIADVEVSTSGNVSITVVREIKGEATTGGTIRYWGNPSVQKITSSTGGSVKKRD